ncbi:sulfotransferase family protein [Streptomyces prunicolor]|uniref:sulfotransferase family protein n=1 Tax=Streptomyces prunicolor TaxID=67348 RepID=UPI00225A1CD9|nr:sulfotransferase family protein [Streptomyces prunicolor]MCX5241309.1 sulfotransferase family protein [Streptomyces prunicolor]
MKIIGVGFPRTGTVTLYEALNQLSLGPCYHTKEMINKPDHIEHWVQVYEGGPIDPHAIFAGYQATADAPGCFFWRELIREYPEAKVILSIRDAQTWYRSMSDTVLRQDLLDKSADPVLAGLRRLALAMFDHVFDNRRDEAHLTAVFNRHNAEVQREVPADRLLVYEVTQGWAPLCEFIGVDSPVTPFPWLNNTAEYVDKAEKHRRSLVRGPVFPGQASGH